MSRIVDQTGLNERLQQHARRSGMLVGLSMAAVVALVIGAFIWIFFRLDPFFSDFAGRSGAPHASPVAARIVVSPRTSAPVTATGNATAVPTTGLPIPPTSTALAATTPAAATPANFQPTHIVADFGQQVNLRAGPSLTASRVAVLTPGTRLRFLGEQDRSGDTVWMRFQIERGDIGWIRQLDVVTFQPGAATPAR